MIPDGTNGQPDRTYLPIEKYSFGVGDRFAHQAKAQLRAFELAANEGVAVTPVWNKSNREHTIVGSQPASVRAAAEAAIREMRWGKPFHVDADHITLKTVDRFLDSSDYFTIDVAEAIGKPPADGDVDNLIGRHPELMQPIDLPGIGGRALSRAAVEAAATQYLSAIKDAGRIYRHIAAHKDPGTFITEVSMDETDLPQKPAELWIILAALADEAVPLQTIAPKFTGRFNKGVDYVGDLAAFESEFRADIEVIAHAVRAYRLPATLKLSVHSGSDKFSIYPAIHRAIAETGAGLHLKTAGTTWLEELIGLAESGGKGLALVKEVYARAYSHREELCAPYAAVIDIDPRVLPPPSHVQEWSSDRFVNMLRHDRSCPEFNPGFRQLLHVGYKIAAGMGQEYLDLLDACEPAIARNVTANLYERHMKPLFIGASDAATGH